MRLSQVFAFKRASKRYLAFCPAAKRADVSIDSRTGTSRPALAAYFAKNYFRHRLPSIIESGQMQRVDLYIKVEVELDEDETPERIAGEICRLLQKTYFVRSAELSSAVPRE
ncbi:MAG: hypothetical protein ACR2IV_10760 [Bryobacteraceae bacterium]